MASPTPKDTLATYDRGSQAFLITNAVATVLQVGIAQPLGANAYGLPPVLQRGALNPNYAIQVDIGAGAGFTALVINILGSLDGINYYSIYTIDDVLTSASGAIRFAAGAGQVRYLSASITTYTPAAGTPTVTVSFCE